MTNPFFVMKRLFFSSVILGLSTFGALAAVSVVASDEKPLEGVAFGFEAEGKTGRSTAFYRGSGGFRHMGQSFVVPKGRTLEMTGVTFRIHDYDTGVLGKRFSIRLYRLQSLRGAGAEPELISSQEGELPDNLGDRDYVTFRLEESLSLQSDGEYIVLFAFEEPTSGDQQAIGIGFDRSAENISGPGLWALVDDRFIGDRKSLTFFIHSH